MRPLFSTAVTASSTKSRRFVHIHYTLNSRKKKKNRMLSPVGTPSRITISSHDSPPRLAIRCSFALASASYTLIPTSPNDVLGVSALAGPNIRLQSDRAGSARSLSPRPPSSGIFSERHRPLTALRLAHYVRHVYMSSDRAQRKSCAVNIQLRKKRPCRDRQL